MNPNIIVLIPHYNRPKALLKSLTSIREPFPVDVMIVDDGSTLKFDENHLRNKYTQGRLYFSYLHKNQGVGAATNHGLQRLQKMNYTLVARLDCGDIFYQNKLSKQTNYLNTHPAVKLLGTWTHFKDENGKLLYTVKHPTNYKAIKKKMYINCMFIQPTVVFYLDLIKSVGYYPEKYKRNAEDYAFFFNIIENHVAENYPEILVDCVVQNHSLSTENRFEQVKNRLSIIYAHFYVGIYPVYGLLRNLPLLFMSRKTTTALKRLWPR